MCSNLLDACGHEVAFDPIRIIEIMILVNYDSIESKKMQQWH
jgi:hypothetical protein